MTGISRNRIVAENPSTNCTQRTRQNRQRRLRLAAVLAAIPVSTIIARTSQAATKYWEPTGTTGTNATGTWNTTSSVWNTDSTAANAALTTFTVGSNAGNTVVSTGDDAVFSDDVNATGPSVIAVSLVSTNVVNSMTFGNPGLGNASAGATGSWTFNGGTIGLGLGSTGTATNVLTMNAGVGAVTINSSLASSVNAPSSLSLNSNIVNNSSSLLTLGGTIFNQENTGTSTFLLTGTGSGGVTISGAIQNNGNNAGGRSTALVINTTGSGATAITTLGGGTNNIYNGGTTITSGIVAFTAANSLGDGSGGTANSGTLSMGAAGQLNLSGLPQGVGAFSGSVGALVYDNSNTSATFTIGNSNGGGGAFAGILEDNSNGGATSGVLSLVKAGTATISLTGANTFTGSTLVNGGGGGVTLSGASGAIASTSAITIGAVGQATSTLTYDNSASGAAAVSRLGSAPSH